VDVSTLSDGRGAIIFEGKEMPPHKKKILDSRESGGDEIHIVKERIKIGFPNNHFWIQDNWKLVLY